MNPTRLTRMAMACSIALLAYSCQKSELKETHALNSAQATNGALAGKGSQPSALFQKAGSQLQQRLSALARPEAWKALVAGKLSAKAVTPSPCGPTQLDVVFNKYVAQFGPDEFANYSLYAAISQLYTFLDDSKQYFGADGQYTHLVNKHQRKLESFWDMPNSIQINGQHNSTLNNKQRIIAVFLAFSDANAAQAAQIADELIAFNQASPVFIETPLLSTDAFATTSRLIVLGDGIIQLLAETGVEDDVVVAGVLSHEWGHQVQFKYSTAWYGVSAEEWPFTPEFTRQTELEADFLSAYYLTQKRGATYNWKRVAEFLELFFNIGDCQFTSSGHHGTPAQRMAAARMAYLLAEQTQPKGHILPATTVHQIFTAVLSSIINGSVPMATAMAGISSAEGKQIFLSLAAHKSELQRIASGKLNGAAIKAL